MIGLLAICLNSRAAGWPASNIIEVAAPVGFPKLPVPSLRKLPDNGLARTPPMGWASYNKFGLAVDDKLIREVADALVTTGMRDAGYD